MYVSQRTYTSREERNTYIDTNIRIYQPMGRNMPDVFNVQNTVVPYGWTHMSVNDSPADT
jgi:hypothetical protein